MVIFVLALLFLIAVTAVTVWILFQEKEASPAMPDPERPSTDTPEDPGAGGVAPTKGPPSAGQGLEALKARLAGMPSEGLQSMLDMGATLKPGAEDLIRAELDRRRESE